MFLARRWLATGLACAIGSSSLAAAPAGVNPVIASGRNDIVCLGPALNRYEALPLGNGQLGVLVRNEHGLDYLFNHGAFFASADESEWLISSGEVAVNLPEAWTKGFVEQRLILHEGKIETTFAAGTVRSWLAEGLDLLVVEIEAKEPLPELTVDVSVWPRAGGMEALPTVAAAQAGEIALTTVGMSRHRATSLLVAAPGAGATTGERSARLTVPGGQRQVTLIVANPCVVAPHATAAAAVTEARRVVAAGRQAGVAALRQQHDEYWRGFWARTEVYMHSDDQFADYLESLYNIFLYTMAGSSRGAEATKFNGGNALFANDWRSWGGCYWYQNTRELYWPLLAADAPELWAPFVDLYVRNLPAMRQQAKDSYNLPGACIDETMRRTGGGDKSGNPYTHLYNTTGTELAHQFYTRYLYTGDEEYLRTAVYPLMKEVVTFHLSFFRKEADGKYHIYPSNSRETWWFVRDSITDLTAIRTVLPILVRLSERFGVDTDLGPHWQDVAANLAAFPVEAKNDTFAPGVFLDEFPPSGLPKAEQLYPNPARRTRLATRNTFNCENCMLEPVYPWGLIGLDSPADALDRMRRTWKTRPYAGWGFGNAWDASAIWAARLGMAQEAVELLRQFVIGDQYFPCGYFGTPGGMPTEWGKVLPDCAGLDGHGVLATAVQEMQLQSYGGVIRVYPAWLKGWQGRFRLAAEGGFVISASIGADGAVPQVDILSRRGGECRVVLPWASGSLDGKPVTGPVAAFATKAGQGYRLTPAQPTAPLVLPEPVRAEGPRWADRRDPTEMADAFLARSVRYGFLGLAKDGNNPARKMVQRAINTRVEELAGAFGRPMQPARRITRTEQAPVIDGQLGDACWKGRLPFGPFFLLGGQEQVADQTEVSAAWDDKALYFGIVCRSRQPDKIVMEAVSNPDPSQIYRDDAVELHLQPDPDAYWQLVVTAGDVRVVNRTVKGELAANQKLDFQSVVVRTKDGWALEVAVPFAALGQAPKSGESWRFNVGRNDRAANQLSTWAPLPKANFGQPAAFGSMEFSSLTNDMAPLLTLNFDKPEDAGLLKNGATLAPGKVGKALDLKGGAFCEVPHSPLLVVEDALTLAAWVFPRNVGARVMDKCSVGVANGYTFDLHPNNRVRLITPYGTLNTDDPIPLRAWSHLTGVLSLADRKLRIYVNGVLKAEGNANPDVGVANRHPLRLGVDSDGGSAFDGLIDEVRLYRRVLSEAEIRQLAQP